MTTALGELASAKYILLTSYRKDGTAVGTPVWAASADGKLHVWTVTESWKVKRIRRNPAVTVQPCDIRGNPHGQVREASAVLLDPAGTDRVRSLLRKKYGVSGQIAMLASILRRGKGGTIGIQINPS